MLSPTAIHRDSRCIAVDDVQKLCANYIWAKQIVRSARSTMTEIYDKAGMLIAPEETEGPATTIEFLGLELDSIAMEVLLPQGKLETLRARLEEARGRKTCKK